MAAVILRNSTHTPHAAVTLPNNRQDKYHRVSEIPGSSSSNFSPTPSTLPQEKKLRTTLNTMRGRRNTVVGCRNFFYMVQINLQIILLLHLGFRLRGQSKTTASDLKETSFPLAAVQMFGLKLLKLLRQEILRLKLLKMLSNVKRGATEGSSDPDSVCYSILNTNTSLGSVNF